MTTYPIYTEVTTQKKAEEHFSALWRQESPDWPTTNYPRSLRKAGLLTKASKDLFNERKCRLLYPRNHSRQPSRWREIVAWETRKLNCVGFQLMLQCLDQDQLLDRPTRAIVREAAKTCEAQQYEQLMAILNSARKSDLDK